MNETRPNFSTRTKVDAALVALFVVGGIFVVCWINGSTRPTTSRAPWRVLR